MRDPWCGRAADWIIHWIPGLPLSLTEGSKSKVVRLIGLVAFFFWFFPAMGLVLIPLLFLMLGEVVQITWRGE